MNPLIPIGNYAVINALALGLSVTALAQTKHTPSIDESISLSTLSDPQISPDGEYVAYSVRGTDWKDNAYITHLWLAEVETGRTFQLTRGKKSSGNAEWSPDGRWLAFVTEREPDASTELETRAKDDKKSEKSESKPAAKQIWLISPQGGEAWQLTKHETDVGGLHWSKESKNIGFLAAPAESKASKDRKEKYSDFDVFEKDFTQSQLWIVGVTLAEATSGPVKAKQITKDPALNVNDFSWSPDSARIAFSATPSPLLAFEGDSDIYLVDLSHENTVHKIVSLPGPDGKPAFSPDGRQLAFSTALGQKYYYYLNSHIATVDLDRVLAHPATHPADLRDVTPNFDEDPDLIDWCPDGIYFAGLKKTASHLFRINTEDGSITRVSQPDSYAAGGIAFTKDFKTIALTASDATRMSEVFVSGVAPFAPRRLTDMNAQLKELKLGTGEMVSWKSADGVTIEGALFKPSDYDPAKKYPLLVVIHGGPTGISRALMEPDSFELYRGLQDQHVPSRLLLYSGFGHGIDKPKSNRAVMQSNLDWFAHYIWGEAIPEDSPLKGSSEVEPEK